MSVSTDLTTKERFSEFAKAMGTNMTNLINMYMKAAPRMKRIEFITPFPEEEANEEEKQSIQKYETEKQIWTTKYINADSLFEQLKQ